MSLWALGNRLLHLATVLLGVSLAVFGMMYLLPGDPAEIIVANSANPNPGAVEEVRRTLGLDKPPHVRFVEWVGGALTGDLGDSYRTNRSVADAIEARLPITLQLALMAQLVSLAVSIPLAIRAARKRDTWFDRAVLTFSFGLQCTPDFVVALILILVFAVNLSLFPAIGYVPISEGLLPNLQSLTLPAIALAAALIPIYTRVLRNEMIRTLQEDFILMARASGLKPRTIVFSYALKPSLPTLVTVVGISIGGLIGGTLIIESIAGLPGIGTLLFDAINSRDYIMVQGIILLIAVVYVVANFLVDLLYITLDPRVKA